MRKVFCALLMFFFVARCLYADSHLDSAVTNFTSNNSPGSPRDRLLVFQADFNADNNAEVVLCYSETDYFKHVGHTWTVLQFKDNQWHELKALNLQGLVDGSFQIAFDETIASFIYVDKFKSYGILSKYQNSWVFIYLEGDALKTVRFKDATSIGTTDEILKGLANTSKITVEQRQIQ